MNKQDPEQVLCQESRPMDQIQSDDVSAAIALYDNHLKPGCQRLLELNRLLLKAERQQRIKQILYRLAWVGGISLLVVIVSYLVIGINIITAVGLLVAYFVGIILHTKYSPDIVLPEEEDELYQLNDKLRHEIVDVEKESQGNLYRLLEATNLEEQARSNGLKLEKGELDIYQLDGNGLYQYLDAMELLMQHRDKLDILR